VETTGYLLGISTRWMDLLIDTLGVTSLSESRVSLMAEALERGGASLWLHSSRCHPAHFVADSQPVSRPDTYGR
jgi:putative transposase